MDWVKCQQIIHIVMTFEDEACVFGQGGGLRVVDSGGVLGRRQQDFFACQALDELREIDGHCIRLNAVPRRERGSYYRLRVLRDNIGPGRHCRAAKSIINAIDNVQNDNFVVEALECESVAVEAICVNASRQDVPTSLTVE